MADEEKTERSSNLYVASILDEAYERICAEEGTDGPFNFNVDEDRIVIFSDHHKGTRTRADDFRNSERSYNAALAYYYHLGHTLITLGDVEELWEERPAAVLHAYEHTNKLESAFHQDGRYVRIWGNHDDDWAVPELVSEYLQPVYGGGPLDIREGVRVRVVDCNADSHETLGHFFLLHGHQGTLSSDRYAWFSRFVVRHLYRPWQRLTNFSLNTPAQDWALRDEHNLGMYQWARNYERLIMICGHTHRPVFASQSLADKLTEQLAELEERIRSGTFGVSSTGGQSTRSASGSSPSSSMPSTEAEPVDTPALEEMMRRQIALLAARLEWTRAQQHQQPGDEGKRDRTIPCYFNTGCCCFDDGDITGIELADGEIRLIRWPGRSDAKPEPQILERAYLRDVFAACC